MKILYFECNSGAAGDMLTAAMLELLPDPEKFVEKLNAVGIPGVSFELKKAEKRGIRGSSVSVLVHGEEECDHRHEDHHHHHEHHHSSFHDIEETVSKLNISGKVKSDVTAIYRIIADAESKVHGEPVEKVHFHEVGALDAVADITAVCMLFEELSPDAVFASDICVGSGEVVCAHGTLPVPAPATAEILKGLPIYSGNIKSELCTPTGAAILKYFVGKFGEMPQMTVQDIGYGMGKKDFPTANCVRAFLGESQDPKSYETAVELSCNIDDMTAEEISFACERLHDAGAKEVYTLPAGMKKSRPGTLVRVICDPNDTEKFVKLIFKYTSTIGVRQTLTKRYILDRKEEKISTDFGEIRIKKSHGYGVTRSKYEYDDLAALAKKHNMTIGEVKALLPKI